jgi:hypothetical protein
MRDPTLAIRALIIYAVTIPLAIFMGYMVATPTDRSTFVVFGLVLATVAIPLLLQWHYPLLFLSWNLSAIVIFLPGRPDLWIFMAMLSFAITIVERALNPELEMNPAPIMFRPLVLLLVVVVATALLTGGIHLGSLGGATSGGRRYIYIIAAVLGFIAMTSRRIPEPQANLYLGLFLLGAVTTLFGELAAYAGPAAKFVWYVFPQYAQATLFSTGDDQSVVVAGGLGEHVGRSYGFTVAFTALLNYMLARYGLKDLLNGRNVPKSILALLFFVGSMIGGFRSSLVALGLTAFFIFWLEGLLRSKYFFTTVVALVVTVTCMILFARDLPLSIQRTLSVLPIEVDPVVRRDAEDTSQWRLKMWKEVLPEIPRYFWLGKGLAINSAELEKGLAFQRGGERETFILSGDYHSGPLSVIIPFGIWGMIGWLWLVGASLRTLYLNYRYGSPSLKTANCFLLAYFLSFITVFFFVFGAFYSGIARAAGVVALSIALNGGVRKPAPEPAPATEPAPKRLKLPQRRLAPGLLP